MAAMVMAHHHLSCTHLSSQCPHVLLCQWQHELRYRAAPPPAAAASSPEIPAGLYHVPKVVWEKERSALYCQNMQFYSFFLLASVQEKKKKATNKGQKKKSHHPTQHTNTHKPQRTLPMKNASFVSVILSSSTKNLELVKTPTKNFSKQ